MERSLPPHRHPGDAPPDDALEALLRRQSWPAPPPDLRATILAAAHPATREPSSASLAPINGAHALSHRPAPSPPACWPELLHRLQSGWSILAAAWALVLALNAYSTASVAGRGPHLPPFSDATLALLRAEAPALDLASLVNPDTPMARPVPGNRTPPPRVPGASPNPLEREKPRARGHSDRRPLMAHA